MHRWVCRYSSTSFRGRSKTDTSQGKHLLRSKRGKKKNWREVQRGDSKIKRKGRNIEGKREDSEVKRVSQDCCSETGEAFFFLGWLTQNLWTFFEDMKLNSESGQKIWESHLQYIIRKEPKIEKCAHFPHTAKDIIQTLLDLKKKTKFWPTKKKKKKKKKKTLIPGSYGGRQKAVQWVSLMSKEQSTKRGRTQEMPGEQSEIRSTLWRLTMYTMNIKTR